MASIEKLKGSNGSGNANVATVQNSRSAGSTSIIVDTVLDINPAGFTGTMGTPHTFTDPVTSEIITVISEATAVDFAGHINSGHIEIDTIAPGYTDAGSKVGDIVVIRPTTQWADNLASVLAAAHNDDGSLVGTAVRTALGETVASGAGWTLLPNTPTSVTALGNGSYSMLFNGVDLTGTVCNGMRLRTTRTVAAPTQCTSLNGTTQYYSKTSPAGMAGTDGYTWLGWIKAAAYAAGTIIGKYNGTSGWSFALAATGQVSINGVNAGAVDSGLSYQSVPLNKWVHVAATLSMSTSTSNIYIDGVLVPSAYTNGVATAWVNAGNLEVGSQNGGTQPFNGKIAQAAIFSAVLTQSTIQSYMSQGLAGTETSEISAYSFSNSINDLNANANNLTANGSALATNADSPFGGQAGGTISSTLDYGIITSASFSTNTTLTVQVPEGCTITSGGISAVSYSTQKTPYGMPGDSKFALSALDSTGTTTTALAATIAQYITPTAIDGITYSNAGTAGGSFLLSMIGSRKTISGLTSSCTTGAGSQTAFGVTLPTGFLTTLQSTNCTIAQAAGSVANNFIIGNSYTTSAITFYINNQSGSAGVGGIVSVIAAGT